jgi:catechol 2,3-dioxygenase-like lactoylglutathione lyase family enzyme
VDVGGLLARIGDGLFQQAFVVADLPGAEHAMRQTLGCGEFVNLPADDLDYDLRGERVSCALALGFARSGNMQIELLQPVRGKGLHVEFLASHGPGAHHLGFLVDDIDAVVAFGAANGVANVMGGQFGTLRFCYLDTFDPLGVYVELVEDPDAILMAIMPWRDPRRTDSSAGDRESAVDRQGLAGDVRGGGAGEK